MSCCLLTTTARGEESFLHLWITCRHPGHVQGSGGEALEVLSQAGQSLLPSLLWPRTRGLCAHLVSGGFKVTSSLWPCLREGTKRRAARELPPVWLGQGQPRRWIPSLSKQPFLRARKKGLKSERKGKDQVGEASAEFWRSELLQ